MAAPPPVAASLPLPATLAPTALPLGWLAPSAVVPAVPVGADGPVATIADRCVRVGMHGAAEHPSLYRLCRQWVQNDPDLGPEALSEVGVPLLRGCLASLLGRAAAHADSAACQAA